MGENRALIVRAVNVENEYRGACRILASKNGLRAPTKIDCICAEFETDDLFNLREDVDPKKLVFYGNQADAMNNSRVPSSADRARIQALVREHQVRSYTSKTVETFQKGTGIARIPLEDLELDQRAIALLGEVFDYYVPILRNLSRKMKKVDLSEKSGRSLSSVMSQFMRFPGGLGEIALQRGYYYSFNHRTNY